MKKLASLAFIVIFVSVGYAQAQTKPVLPEKVLVEFFYKNLDVMPVVIQVEKTRLAPTLEFKEYNYSENAEAKSRVAKIIEHFPEIDLICVVNGKFLAGSNDIKIYFEQFLYHVGNPDKVQHPYTLLQKAEENKSVSDTTVDGLDEKINYILAFLVLLLLGYIKKLPKWAQAFISVLATGGKKYVDTLKEKGKDKTDES